MNNIDKFGNVSPEINLRPQVRIEVLNEGQRVEPLMLFYATDADDLSDLCDLIYQAVDIWGVKA